jgi:hypothetical protein
MFLPVLFCTGPFERSAHLAVSEFSLGNATACSEIRMRAPRLFLLFVRRRLINAVVWLYVSKATIIAGVR